MHNFLYTQIDLKGFDVQGFRAEPFLEWVTRAEGISKSKAFLNRHFTRENAMI